MVNLYQDMLQWNEACVTDTRKVNIGYHNPENVT